MADQNVVILGGSGNVGREFLSQVIQHDTVFSNKHLNPTNIIALTNSKGFWFNKQGLEIQKSPENADKWKSSKEAFTKYMQGLDQFLEYDNLAELLKLIEAEGMSGEIVFVDVSSGKDDLRDFHLKVINDSDESMVTANKNPLSIYLDRYLSCGAIPISGARFSLPQYLRRQSHRRYKTAYVPKESDAESLPEFFDSWVQFAVE